MNGVNIVISRYNKKNSVKGRVGGGGGLEFIFVNIFFRRKDYMKLLKFVF